MSDCASYLNNGLTFQLSPQSLPIFIITSLIIKLLNYYFCFCSVHPLHLHSRLYQTENVCCLCIMCFIPINTLEVNSNFGPWCLRRALSLADRGLLLEVSRTASRNCSFWIQLVRAEATDSSKKGVCGSVVNLTTLETQV